jgi:hypothetical protein
MADLERRPAMPLSFDTCSHGPVAFGFFNIESDMLLLDRFFFFGDDFCAWITALADQASPAFLNCEVFHIKNLEDVGDLMGAIHGIRFTGFIGRVYEQFAFPQDPARFKQNPKGFQTRQTMQDLIAPFAEKQTVQAGFDPPGHFRFGPYEFTGSVFHELIRYVWQGGYPRWKDGVRPAYVTAMADHIKNSKNRFLSGVFA